MQIQAELSFYPLGTDAVGERVNAFIEGLKDPRIRVFPGPMSTVISGENSDVFAVVQQCFAVSARSGAGVLCARFSNACPAVDLSDRQE